MSSIVLRFVVAAITSSASVASSTSDLFAINITEPLYRYGGPEDCSDSYDLVRPELLIFNVNVICMKQVEFSAVILNRATNGRLPGCRKFCQPSQHGTCNVHCNVSDLPDTSTYLIKASAMDLSGDKTWTVCINAKDMAQVSFVARQPTDVWSADGSVQLHFEATGYPRPINYELSCDGRQESISSSGDFSLADLPSGTTHCTALAYTNRRLMWTEPLTVLIHVDPGKTFTGSTFVTDSFGTGSSSGAALSSTQSMSTAASTSRSTSTAASTLTIFTSTAAASSSKNNSVFPMTTFLPTTLSVPQAMPQPHAGGGEGGVTDSTVLIAGIVVPCTMVTILVALVIFGLFKRRIKKKLQCSSGGATSTTVAALQLPHSPGLGSTCSSSAASIINNNNTNITIFNNTYKLQGQHIVHESDTFDIDDSCSRHYDDLEHGRGADDENIVSRDSRGLSELLQPLGNLAPTPPSPPLTLLPSERTRTDCRETSQKHPTESVAGYRNDKAPSNPHTGTAIRRLSQQSITSVLTASLEGNNEESVPKSSSSGAGGTHCHSVWARSTKGGQQHVQPPLYSLLSKTAAEADVDKRLKSPKYSVVGATRDWNGSAFC